MYVDVERASMERHRERLHGSECMHALRELAWTDVRGCSWKIVRSIPTHPHFWFHFFQAPVEIF